MKKKNLCNQRRKTMFAKKLISAALAAALILTPAHAGSMPQATVTAYAQNSIRFCAGLAYENRTEKLSSIKVPLGCISSFYSPDVASADGLLTVSDPKIASLTAFHKGVGWTLEGKKAGKASVQCKQGSKTGKLDVEVLPALKLKAVKKSAKASGGKVSLTVKYKNNTDSDITIEGVDIGGAQILFEGEKAPSKEADTPVRWIAKKATIPAGKAKTFTVSEPTSQTGKIKKFGYPGLYLKYKGSYFQAHISGSQATGFIGYSTMPFQQFTK